MNNQIKSRLINRIKVESAEQCLGQRDLARIFDMHQARVSNLIAERSYMFTVDELIVCVEALGFNVELTTTPKE
jgi:predicted XRE-type DNA-binding protein